MKGAKPILVLQGFLKQKGKKISIMRKNTIQVTYFLLQEIRSIFNNDEYHALFSFTHVSQGQYLLPLPLPLLGGKGVPLAKSPKVLPLPLPP